MSSYSSGSASITNNQSRPSGSASNAEYQDIWKCGDPFKYSCIPEEYLEENVDHWSNLLDPLVKTDKEQCDAWKNEIKYLLIFAGLFSAVVTAFVIISFQAFQPSPNQVIIAILVQVATSLNNIQSGPSADIQPIPPLDLNSITRPSSAISRINVLWFASLVLSLTAALGGIVGLQWLREYQRSTPRGTSKEKFAYFNMRRDSFEEWFVPEILLALPVLLLLALVLFLVGLIEFLLANAPHQVSTPIIAIIAVPITFIFVTTVLPALEWILPPTIYIKFRQRVPTQCPYKSPQSFLSRTLLSPICSFLLSSIIHLPKICDDFKDANIRWKSLLSTFPHNPHDRSDMIALFYRELFHEELYLAKKKAQFLGIKGDFSCPFAKPLERRTAIPALYDLIEGLKYADRQGSRNLPVQAACYRCVQALVPMANQESVFVSEEECHRYIQSMLQKDWPNCEPHFSLDNFMNEAMFQPSTIAGALRDETRVSVLRAFNWDVSARYMHGHELHIRLMHFYFSNMRTGTTLTETTRNRLFLFWRNSSPVTDNQILPIISNQYTSLLKLLFDKVEIFAPMHDAAIPTDFLPHPHLGQFIETACWNQTPEHIKHVIEFIEKKIKDYPPGPNVSSSRYLLPVLTASYIETATSRLGPLGPQISWKLDLLNICKRIAHESITFQAAQGGRLLMEGSVLCGELNGYLNYFLSDPPQTTPPVPNDRNTSQAVDTIPGQQDISVAFPVGATPSNNAEIMFPGGRTLPQPNYLHLWFDLPTSMQQYRQIVTGVIATGGYSCQYMRRFGDIFSPLIERLPFAGGRHLGNSNIQLAVTNDN